jgi:hypothetical protein
MIDSEKKGLGFFFPDIDDLKKAEKAARLGAGAGFFCGVVTLLWIFFGGSENGYWPLVDVSIIFALAYGTWNFSRIAGAGGFLFYLMEKGYQLSQSDHPNMMVIILFAALFMTGMRGCFAYHRLIKTPPPSAPRTAPRTAPRPIPTPTLQPLGIPQQKTHPHPVANQSPEKKTNQQQH